MYDFGRFCYLDVQKTGSSFIGRLLKECAHLEPVHYGGHKPILGKDRENLFGLLNRPGHFRRDTFYFNSIRDPFDYYASLYNYGCGGKGGLHKLLVQSNHSDLYDNTEDGFLRWVAFVTRSENARYLGNSFAECHNGVLGFLTFRFLRLSMVAPIAKLRRIQSVDDANRLFDTQNICQFTIRNEHMSQDIQFLIDNSLHDHIDKDRARAFLERDKINASKSKVATGAMLAASPLGDLIRKRDALVFDKFYPDAIS